MFYIAEAWLRVCLSKSSKNKETNKSSPHPKSHNYDKKDVLKESILHFMKQYWACQTRIVSNQLIHFF